MLELEKELHEKRELELEVTRLNGTLQVMKHLEGDDDGDIHDKMEKLSEKLEHERKRLEELSGELVRKERESNDELQEARKELIMVLLLSLPRSEISLHLMNFKLVDELALFH